MRTCTLVFAALITLLGVGCQTSTPASSQTMASPQHAVVVTGGNGTSSTVFIPSADPENPVILCSAGTEVCPECKAAAIKYFSTGVLDPKCSRTGATRTLVVPTTPSVSHN